MPTNAYTTPRITIAPTHVFCTRSRRFTPPPTRPPFEPPECGPPTNPRTDRADAPGGPAGIRLASYNPDSLRGNQARTRHPASKDTEALSWPENTSAPELGQQHCLCRTLRISE